jgi:NADH-quinone oxidoreductase subunit L
MKTARFLLLSVFQFRPLKSVRWGNRLVVDGSINGVAVLVQSGARAFRLLQTGVVQNYLLIMAVGVFVFATLYLIFT